METVRWYLSKLLNIRAASAEDYIPFVMHTNPVADDETRHYHMDFFSLMIVRQGKGLHVIDGVPYGIARGDVYVMRPGAHHSWSQCEDLFVDACYFTTQLLDKEALDALQETPGFTPLFEETAWDGAAGGTRWLHLTPEAYDMVRANLLEIQNEWLARTRIGTLLTKFAFVRLLAHLSLLYDQERNGAFQPTHSGSDFRRASEREMTVAAAVRYIEENFAEPISIEQVAASVFMSPVRLREVFGLVMGCSPRDYLRHVRIEQAKRRLSNTGDPITQIGYDVGFSEASYFGRAFREATGMSPREYRNKSMSGT